MAPDSISRPFPIGRRGGVILALLVAGVWSYTHLGVSLSELWPHDAGLKAAKRFFGRALSPALTAEASSVDASVSVVASALAAAWTTVVYATAGMSLALLIGIVLGFFASTAWWAGDPTATRSAWRRAARGTLAPLVYGSTRTVIALMRSVHEVLWAVLFLAAFGLTPLSAVFAIAIPYGGTLAKIFSEMVDEAPRAPAYALRGAGASGAQVFCFGLVPLALPDMMAYAFYRFECALRSSAVLGFFGYETLGYQIERAWVGTHYGEVWTCLYVLIGMVVLFDWWSGALRRRFVA